MGDHQTQPVLGPGARLRSLAAMARALGRCGGLHLTIEKAAEEALECLRAATVSISRLQPGTDEVRVVVNVGDLAPDEVRWPEDEVYRLSDYRLLLGVVEQQRAWFASIDDPDLDPTERRLLEHLEKGSALGSPLIVDGALWGELYATRHVGAQPFGEDDRAYVEALGAILGSAVGRDLQVAALQGLAYRDPLTGISNRRALDRAGEAAMAEHAARGTTVVLAAIDVDGLKRVNDSQGHSEGDRVLIAAAQVLTTQFAALPGAMVARIGGDEFCVLVSGRPPDTVAEVAEAACRQVLPWGAGLSCGIVGAPARGPATFRSLSLAADSALYRAKKDGGYRLVLDECAR